ncbi:Clavaminate synthase-like protein [Aulographum hederae CBS 113979]|uniref:Clavaminate synthase-like protein n=1 Tax=Aulographum hederae CBS 113979 TaxID=1176131 RepID=A0A6G1H0F1_9PEZI|nr:Clavaminate synthase-like protein [Aulographum hederae CBS 113979]
MNLDSLVELPLPGGPNIQWDPSYATYRARVNMLAKLDLPRPNQVPQGFPEMVSAPWAWDGSEYDDGDNYVLKLTEDDIEEIERALRYFKQRPGRLDPGQVSRLTFPLPKLGNRLKAVSIELHKGRGFSVLRGLEPRKYSAFDNVLIYLGVTSYVAEKRGCQDSSGNMIIHVKDVGKEVRNSEMRQSPYANNAQPFHTDVCDVLAMYVQEQAAEGGDSHLASGARIYNEIARTRPDVIHTLADPSWIFDKHQTPAYWNTRALLFSFEEHGPGFCFSRRPITGSPTSPRSPGVPPMTEVQAEALDMVHFLAKKYSLTMRLQRGDIQLINNLAIFHSRSGFRDSQTQTRHIMRLWLRNEELAWKTPDGLKKTWFEKYGDSDRRKIARWNILPGAKRERILFRSDSCS